MFSKIGSYLDGATSDCARVSYARLYVEIAADKMVEEVGKKGRKEWRPKAMEERVCILEQPDMSSIEEFNDCVGDVGLVEHPHTGSQFTWSRNWNEGGVVRVLDRVLCNLQWLDEFKQYIVDIPVPCDSDNCLLNIEVSHNLRLNELRIRLKRLSAESFSNISIRVVEKRIQLEEVNGRLLARNLDSELQVKAANVEKDYKMLSNAKF
ncbi:hypothetical protein LIER_14096 [Lithospermum erythrorhizon]|uniref:Uncharacterized protein n=1 Tax=Lithospermum erythrorhizon TaxID=34254 RepID=A0AAV3PZE4_LITER